MKLFYTGPKINTEMLVTMLEKHGIQATEVTPLHAHPDDLNAESQVFVPDEQFPLAHRLFYSEREDEL